MKLSHILNEKITAPVHTSVDKKISVIANAIEKQFGIDTRGASFGCLLSQFMFSVSIVTQISPQKLIDAAYKDSRFKRAVMNNEKGITFKDLFEAFHKPLTIDNKTLKLSMSMHEFNIDEALNEIKTGQPVLMVAPAPFLVDIEHSAVRGESTLERLDDFIHYGPNDIAEDLMRFSYGHTYMIVGYDEDGFVVVRDNRSTYLFKGYLKIDIEIFKKYHKLYKLFSIQVNSYTYE